MDNGKGKACIFGIAGAADAAAAAASADFFFVLQLLRLMHLVVGLLMHLLLMHSKPAPLVLMPVLPP